LGLHAVGGCGRLLREFADFSDALGDIGSCLLKLVYSRGDAIELLCNLAARLLDPFEGVAGFGGGPGAGIHLRCAVFHRLHRGVDTVLNATDEGGDLLCGTSNAFRELADFVRHHREPASLLSSTCSFDCRVERQQVGLRGDIFDYRDDLADLSRSVSEFRDFL
jgi:hypothetical protein